MIERAMNEQIAIATNAEIDFESTPQMRARIDELSCECRDDFDRAVQMLLRDFKRLLGLVRGAQGLEGQAQAHQRMEDENATEENAK